MLDVLEKCHVMLDCNYFLVDNSFVVVLDNNLIEVLDSSFVVVVGVLDNNFVVAVPVIDNSCELVMRIYFGRLDVEFVVLHKLELVLFDNYCSYSFVQVLVLV